MKNKDKCWSNWTPTPEDKFDQPKEPDKVFDVWSFFIGIATAVGLWLWYFVFTELIF